MAATAFGNAIEFMTRVGIFDVVLPFLLVFTLMFSFLEKTKIFGTEKYLSEEDGKHYVMSRKNLNGMTSFVIAFFVVASSRLVAIINEVASRIVLVVLLVFAFMLTVGALNKQEKDGFFLKGPWKSAFYVIVFIAIIAIFMNALGWLQDIFSWIGGIFTNEAGAAILMIIIILIFMFYITYSPREGGKKSKKEDDS